MAEKQLLRTVELYLAWHFMGKDPLKMEWKKKIGAKATENKR